MNTYQWEALAGFVIIGIILIIFRRTQWVKKSWKYIVAIAPVVIFALGALKKAAPASVPRTSTIPPTAAPTTAPAPQASTAPVPITPNIIIGLDYQLSPNFNFGMMTITENRNIIEQNRQEGLKYLDNLRRLCNEILEPVIILIGPTFITSAFRCFALNSSVGGAKNSQHTVAEAADTHYKIPLREAYNKIAFSSKIPYAQLILEFDQWVHISLIDHVLYPGKVGQNLIASKQNGKTVYTTIVNPI
jgi:hypothetical protein